MKNLFIAFILLLPSAITSTSSSAAEAEGSTFILFKVTSDGPLIIRRLVFSSRRSDNEYIAQDLQSIGRGVTNYILDPIKPGKYFLDSIYPALSDREHGNRVDVDDKDGVITIVENAINYVGDIFIESDETSFNVSEIVDFVYTPNSATLMAAVAAQPELFQELDVVITIAGSKPMKVDKKLLGLE